MPGVPELLEHRVWCEGVAGLVAEGGAVAAHRGQRGGDVQVQVAGARDAVVRPAGDCIIEELRLRSST